MKQVNVAFYDPNSGAVTGTFNGPKNMLSKETNWVNIPKDTHIDGLSEWVVDAGKLVCSGDNLLVLYQKLKIELNDYIEKLFGIGSALSQTYQAKTDQARAVLNDPRQKSPLLEAEVKFTGEALEQVARTILTKAENWENTRTQIEIIRQLFQATAGKAASREEVVATFDKSIQEITSLYNG